MKKFVFWTAMAVILMIGCPWLTVSFAGESGMAVCFILFFAINPVFSAICGVFAGRNVKLLWPLPIITAALFWAGAWIFFEMGEPDFLLYGGGYLLIGGLATLIVALIKRSKQ